MDSQSIASRVLVPTVAVGSLGTGATHASLARPLLARRIHTGCVFEAQLPGTFGLLVTRADPRTRRGTLHGRRQVRAMVHAHWPLFAPSMRLLAGRSADGVALLPGWPSFAAAYRAELEAWPYHTRLAVARQIVAWLRTFETVTILSCERRIPSGSTPACWAQRHVFHDWLCRLLPLALPMPLSTMPFGPDGLAAPSCPR